MPVWVGVRPLRGLKQQQLAVEKTGCIFPATVAINTLTRRHMLIHRETPSVRLLNWYNSEMWWLITFRGMAEWTGIEKSLRLWIVWWDGGRGGVWHVLGPWQVQRWNVPGCFNGVCLSTPVELIASHWSQMSYENIWWNERERGGGKGWGGSVRGFIPKDRRVVWLSHRISIKRQVWGTR